MENLTSEGVCFYCKETKTGAGIGRHLSSHLKKIEKESVTKKTAYHLKISCSSLYFLHILIHENSNLEDLDAYLRAIWLECCGHMSSFEIKGKRSGGGWFDDDMEFGIKKHVAVKKTFVKGLKLTYEYDFGSTTQLDIQVANAYNIDITKEGIILLSRNEPLKYLCSKCGEKPAEVLCSVCWENNTFCKSCKKIHAKECEDFADYSEMDLVNSPRAGVCGYDGGRIDLERDGIWKK
ncbi:MAG: hypothetical protein ACI85O_001010 [Saprospiraceae bacterium]|jgi:hypothetical protein